VNREQTIAGYFAAFSETAGNPAAHDELQRRLALTDLFFLLGFVLAVGKWRPRLTVTLTYGGASIENPP